MKVLTKKDTTGWMMNFAWTLEIILCLTGILIAFSLNYIGVSDDSSESLPLSTWLILTMGSLPLFAVAISELFKIPMVTGFLYADSLKVKILAFCGLALICLLTFETMLTGQEQVFEFQGRQIKAHQRTENIISDKINLIDEQIIAVASLSPEDIRKKGNEGIQDQLSAINEQIDDLRKREEALANTMNPAEVSELKRQITSLESSKLTIEANNREGLKSLNEELKQLNVDEQTELANTSFFKGKIKDQYEDRREEIKVEKITLNTIYKKDIDKVNRKITTLNNKVTKLSQPNEQLLDQLTLLASQISKAQQEKSSMIKSVNDQVDISVIAAQNSQTRINELNIEKVELGEELVQIRESLATSSGNSFIYRLAGLYHGVDNLADLTEEQAGNFALIFMISVAAVISVLGPMVTFVAYSIYIETEAPKKPKLVPAMRAAIIDLRKKLRNPKIITQIEEVEVEKEIIKEVFLEKIVEKEILVEVPVEKIIYETVVKPEPFQVPIYVQVPVPTDAKDFPEMADLKNNNVTPIVSAGGSQ